MMMSMAGHALLHIIGGNDRGKQFELNKPENRIGRGTDQDVVLADIAVSRRHVTILMEGQRFRLKDLGSGNGSLVNGQRMDSGLLNDGDQIEIGNTLMRFDHAASRPVAVPPAPSMPPMAPPGYPPSYPGMAPGYPPPGYGAPPGYPPSYGGMAPPGYPPGYAAPGPAYPAGYPPPAYGSMAGYPPGFSASGVDPSLSAANAMPGFSSGVAPPYTPQPPVPSRAATPRGSSGGRLVLFGAMLLVSLGGIAAIVSRTVFAAPPVIASEAEELYRQGLRLFAAGDYELAKAKFNDAVQQAQDSPEPRRYARLCDTEMAARTSLKNAERALVNRRYVEAVRALDGVESTSVYYDQASRQRKDTAPKAAGEMIDEAHRLAQDNPEEARSRLKAALELDPNNSDGRDLLNRIRSGGPLPPAGSGAPPSMLGTGRANPPPSAATVAAVTPRDPPRRAPQRRAKEDDDPDALVKPGKIAASAPAAAPDSKAAMAAYRARDFAGAAKLYMQESMKQTEKQAIKTIEFANQVRQLQQIVDRATVDEAKNAPQAVKEYDQAIQLDQKLTRGVHAAFFKGRMGSLGVQAAKQSFSQGNYEAAYQAAMAAQKGGGDASGLLRQLDQKAAELVSQGLAVQKSNIGQAKQYWRTVLKIVPSSSPNYTKAYSLINSASAPRRDEDED